MSLQFKAHDPALPSSLLPLPLVQVSGMRPLCCPEVSLAVPAPRTAAASGSPAPAPCVQIYETLRRNLQIMKDLLTAQT